MLLREYKTNPVVPSEQAAQIQPQIPSHAYFVVHCELIWGVFKFVFYVFIGRVRQSTHPPNHFPDAYNGQCCVILKPGLRNSILVCCTDDRNTTTLKPSQLPLRPALAGR